MKRLTFSSLTFLVTLSVGVLAVWLTVKNEEVTIAVSPSKSKAPKFTTGRVPDPKFRPEFLDVLNSEVDNDKIDDNMIDLATDGIYRRSEVVAKNGEWWLVLVKNVDSYSVVRSKAKVRKLKTASWPGDEYDASLDFSVKGTPILAVKGIRGIASGPVTTLFFNDSRFVEDAVIWNEKLSDKYRREFVLNGSTYVLRTSTALSKGGTQLFVLVLESNGSSQIVDSQRFFPESLNNFGDVLWVGDIDQDGKLDLYIDEFNEKGYFHSKLFLSSSASNGKLLKIVGTFGMAGC